MHTPCNAALNLQPLGRRQIHAAFDGGRVSSDGGALLLREVESVNGLFARVAACFDDHRDQRYVEHSVRELVAQRLLALCLGSEDISDHDTLRVDPVLAAAVGKVDPFGQSRRHARDKGAALAAHASLHRLETAPAAPNTRRDLKITHRPEAFEALLVDLYLDAHRDEPDEIVLDLDATDDPIHGAQEGRFYHGYYGNYCYLPLYIMIGDHVVVAKLRTSDQDGAAGAVEAVQRVVARIRTRWKNVHIVLRADSGFCREPLMAWCEAEPGVDYVFGLARNSRLTPHIEGDLAEMAKKTAETNEPHRKFREITYQTQNTWSRSRRVVAKAEALVGKLNPRFVVTSLSEDAWPAQALYERLYCSRGEMENRIKEQQMGLFADRTSSHTMRANQLRLWFSTLAYALFNTLRSVGLKGTTFARAQVWTVRSALLKVGAVVRESVRRVQVSLSSAFPHAEVWRMALSNIAAAQRAVAM